MSDRAAAREGMDENGGGEEMRRRMTLGAAIAIGIGVGAAMGAALRNMPVGIAIGLAFGVVLMVTSEAAARRGATPL
jgi:hypothetical protein